MDFVVKSGKVEKQRTACAIVGVYGNCDLSPSAQALDALSGGQITQLLETGDLKSQAGSTLLIHNTGKTTIERILLVACGKETILSPRDFIKMVEGALKAIIPLNAKDALMTLAEVEVQDRDLAWKARQIVEKAGEQVYRFDQMKGKPDKNGKPTLRKLALLIAGRGSKQAEQAVKEGRAIVEGMNLAKDLANLPGNVCTPTYLAKQGRGLSRKYKNIKTSVLDEKDMEKLGMGSLLSVSRGSREPAKLIVMEYDGLGTAKGAKKTKPIVLVGKGLTFDAGGISIKPAAAMDEMKYDMCGGASVIGTLKAVAEMELPIRLIGIVPSSENLPDGAANKPGDIVKSMSGQTIEILNTDAEGRLILCDALTYSRKYKPELVIDIATLTGACVIALGQHASGLLSNDDELAAEILAAGNNSGDRAWQLPLWDDYQDQLKSNFADMANIGGREAGTITAACFLSRYTKDLRWAHLDIAGSAWLSGAQKGATGRPVPLLTQFLIDQAAK